MLLELQDPIKVAGKIDLIFHDFLGCVYGQYYDMLKLFDLGGYPPESNYLFLGNYVGWGKCVIETICLLFAYKIKYPEKIFLLRGSHEITDDFCKYEFYDECKVLSKSGFIISKARKDIMSNYGSSLEMYLIAFQSLH